MGDQNISHQNQTSHIFNASSPVNNYTDLDDDRISVIDYNYGIIWLSISSFGIVGNTLSFVVLFQLAKSSSFYLYLASLAVSDLAALIVGCIWHWEEMNGVYKSKSSAQLVCSAIMASLQIFSQLSSCITAAVTVDRYIAVCHPFKVNKYCTRKRALIYIGVIFLVLVAVNFPIICFQWNDANSSCVVPEFTNDYCLDYNYYIDTSIYILVPFCVISILNILIIRGIRAAKSRRRRMTPGNVNSSCPTANANESTTRTVTVLLTITAFFIVSFVPLICETLFRSFYEGNWNDIRELYPIVFVMGNIGMLLNHSSNFVLYGLSGQRFREKFVNIFCCRQ